MTDKEIFDNFRKYLKLSTFEFSINQIKEFIKNSNLKLDEILDKWLELKWIKDITLAINSEISDAQYPAWNKLNDTAQKRFLQLFKSKDQYENCRNNHINDRRKFEFLVWISPKD